MKTLISFALALVLSVEAIDSQSVQARNWAHNKFWESSSPCKKYKPDKGDDSFHARPSYFYSIDKFAVNNKSPGWFEHLEYCVTKDEDGKMWLNAATHIFPPLGEETMVENSIFQSWLQHKDLSKTTRIELEEESEENQNDEQYQLAYWENAICTMTYKPGQPGDGTFDLKQSCGIIPLFMYTTGTAEDTGKGIDGCRGWQLNSEFTKFYPTGIDDVVGKDQPFATCSMKRPLKFENKNPKNMQNFREERDDLGELQELEYRVGFNYFTFQQSKRRLAYGHSNALKFHIELGAALLTASAAAGVTLLSLAF